MTTQPTGAKGFGGRLAQERRLKAVREHRDVQRQDVAKAMGVSNSTYGRWEDGTVPGDAMMERLARYFGVTPAWLRYGQEPRIPGVREDVAEPAALTIARAGKRAAGKSRGKASGG